MACTVDAGLIGTGLFLRRELQPLPLLPGVGQQLIPIRLLPSAVPQLDTDGNDRVVVVDEDDSGDGGSGGDTVLLLLLVATVCMCLATLLPRAARNNRWDGQNRAHICFGSFFFCYENYTPQHHIREFQANSVVAFSEMNRLFFRDQFFLKKITFAPTLNKPEL